MKSRTAIFGNADWLATFEIVYLTGIVLLVIRLAFDQISIRQVAQRSTEVVDPHWSRLVGECAAQMGVRHNPRLVGDKETTMPMTFGIWRGTIIIPAAASAWSEDR